MRIAANSGRSALVFLTTLLVIALFMGGNAEPVEARSGEVKLRVASPKKVEVGKPINLTFSLENARNVGGYEANVLFDTGVAEFAAVRQDALGLSRNGRDVGSIDAVETPEGVSVGAFSCPVDDCTVRRGGERVDQGVSGRVTLATVSIVPKSAGKMTLRIAQMKVVDAQGREISSGSRERVITVQVGEGSAVIAPSKSPGWTLKGRAGAGKRKSSDIISNGAVTNADLSEASLAWMTTRLDGDVCSPESMEKKADVNSDGCIDVADLQSVASNFGVSSSSDRSTAGTFSARSTAESTFTVNSALDTSDANPGDGVCAVSAGGCTLRAAIQEADLLPGANTINFNIPGSGIQTIQLGARLPSISDETGTTTIDGYTQPGASPNTDPRVSNAQVRVQITTAPNSTRDALYITSPGNTIRGLAFFRLRQPISLYGAGATGNSIVGNFVGTDAAGTYSAPTSTVHADGINLKAGASSNFIGGTADADRNVVSGNAYRGVAFFGEVTDGNTVINNIVGLNPLATAALPNLRHGIDINSGSSQNVIGGTESGQRNLVSGNAQIGVEISHDPITTENLIAGNFIGTDPSGNALTSYSGNTQWGIHIEDRVTNNTVRDNVVGGNVKGGVRVGALSTGMVLENNRIGISPNGSQIPNLAAGVQIDSDSSGNRVGPNNVIAHNRSAGIRVAAENSDRNTLTRNSIFDNRPLGIDILPLGEPNPNDIGDVDTGANEQLNFPEISEASPTRIVGTACEGCTIEAFVSDRGAGAYGQGKNYRGSVVAGSDGTFTLEVGNTAGEYITTTATDAQGNTSEFSPNRIISLDTTAPAVPANLTVQGSQSEVTLDWQDNRESDLAGYSVYRSTRSGGPYMRLNSSAVSSSSYRDTNLVPRKTYYYVISALDRAGNESGYSNEGAGTYRETSLKFDGVNDTVSIPDSTFINLSNANRRSYEMKFKTSSDTTSRQILLDEGGRSNGFSVEIRNGRLYFNAWAQPTTGLQSISTSTPVSPNTAYHMAGVYDNPSNRMSLYLDGGLVDTATGTRIVYSHSDNTALGGVAEFVRGHDGTLLSAGASPFSGSMSDFRIWNVALTPAQVASGATPAEPSGNESGLAVLYRMNEGTGNILNDATQNDIDATINGATWFPPEEEQIAAPPAAPTGLAASAAQGRIDLDWQDNQESDLAGYDVYRSETAGGPYSKLNDSALLSESVYSDETVTPGTTYHYVVSATNADDSESPYSEEVSASALEEPPPPPEPRLVFDGTDDFIAVPDSNLINTAFSNRRTYEVSMTTGSDVMRQQFVYEEGGPANGYSVEIEGGRVYFNVWANTSSGVRLNSVSAPVEPNTAYDVAGTYNNPQNMVSIYLNGELSETSTAPGGVQVHSDNTALGGVDGSSRGHADTQVSAGSGYFGGEMNEFRIWNNSLGQDQIRANRISAPTGNENGLIVSYRMDEGSGNTLEDATQNNIDATVNGATWVS